MSLTANGATSYTWSDGSNGNQLSGTPTITGTYSVTGTNNLGCINSAIFTQSVSECIGIKENEFISLGLKVYPNPSSGEFFINSDIALELFIYNDLGQLLKSLNINATTQKILVNNLSKGVYLLLGKTAHYTIRQKIIISN
jgi:hypothetical protein